VRCGMLPSQPSILIVDDEPDVRSGLRDVLEREGFAVREAGSGTRALALLTEAPSDLMVTDLGMPDMDGAALCRAALERLPNLSVIVLTGLRVRGMRALQGAEGRSLACRCASTNHSHLSVPRDTSVNRSAVS